MNPYQILGVSKDADAETIKKAYRGLVKKCHPDTHPGDEKAEEQFKQVSWAYETLSNEKKRREYDKKSADSKKAGSKDSGVDKKGKMQKEQPINPYHFQQEFEQFFGFQNQKKTTTKNNENIAAMDTSALFEKYMGFR